MLGKSSMHPFIICRRYLLPALMLVVFAFLFVRAAPALAQGTEPVNAGLQAVGEAGGIASGNTDLLQIIGRIIYVALSLVGIILLGLLLYAGYLWMTSAGDATKIDQAKTMIRNAIIGLIIIVSAFAITQFILNALIGATTTGGGVFGGRGGGGGFGLPNASGSLGGGIIESHVPARNARDVPRNTGIAITFKEPIKLSSFIRDYNDNGTPSNLSDDPASSTTVGLNGDVIKIYPTGQRDRALTSAQARVRFTLDRQTFVIRPVLPIGSATTSMSYTVELVAGGSGLLLENGNAAFGRGFSSGYKWEFMVSTVIDNTPPKVTGVTPRDGGGPYAPNVIVQINFNEPIDPSTASGLVTGGSGFTNIELQSTPIPDGPVARPNGEYKVSNQYRTVEFVSDLSCGTNSCGRTVYCLPADSSISVMVKAATLSETPPLALFTDSGVDGVTDMSGNSLDGNRNNTAEGRDTDDYAWRFATLSEPNLEAPSIRETEPTAGDFGVGASSNIDVEQEPQAIFSSILQGSTVNSSNVLLRRREPGVPEDSFWWTPRQDMLTAAGAVADYGEEAVYGRISIEHRTYLPASESLIPIYQPVLSSGIQNIYQNCFNPASSARPACAGAPNCCDGRPSETACLAP